MKANLFLLLLLLPTLVLAQEKPNGGVDMLSNLSAIAADGGSNVVRTFNPHEMKGSPFLYDNWFSADLMLHNKQKKEGVLIKYDVYDNLLLAKRPGTNDSIIIRKNTVKGFVLRHPGYPEGIMFMSGYQSDEPDFEFDHYAEVLEDGKNYSLLRRHTCTIFKDQAAAYGTGKKTTTFSKGSHFLLLDESGKAKKFKTKKQFLNLFEAKLSQKVKNFMKEKDLSHKSAGDMTKVVVWLNNQVQ